MTSYMPIYGQAVPEWDPASTDGPGQTSQTATFLTARGTLVFASTAARDAAVPLADRFDGMEAVVGGVVWRWSSAAGAWKLRDDFTKSADLYTDMAANSPMIGTYNPDVPVLQKAETRVVSVAGSGGFNVPFPSAFPNYLKSVIVTPGDNFSNFAFATVILGNCTLGNINGVAYQPGGSVVAAASAIRINYVAVGG